MNSESITAFTAQPGFTAGFVGAALSLPLVVLRGIASADTHRVALLGSDLHLGCWFNQRFGVPCPACGMTRSVILSLHGHFNEAFALNAAGLLGVIGLLLFSASLFLLMTRQRMNPHVSVEALERRIRLGTSVYGAIVVAVWMIQWTLKISGRV